MCYKGREYVIVVPLTANRVPSSRLEGTSTRAKLTSPLNSLYGKVYKGNKKELSMI